MNRYNIEDSGSIELRFLIPSKAAGIIIGKGGENVKDIREKYEIKVNIPDSPGPERVLQISGRSASVFEALEIMLEKAKDCMPANEADIYTNRNKPRRSRSNRGDDDGVHGDDDSPGGVDLRMLIHQSQAGSVIGRGGERIKELREQSDLRALKMYQNTCPSSTDRVAQIVGEVPKVMRCVKTITELLQAHQPRGSEQPYDARTYEESMALSYGGWLSKAAMKTVQEYGVQALVIGGSAGGVSSNPAMANSALAAIHAARASMVSHGTQPPPSRFASGGSVGRSGMQEVMAAAAANPMMMMSMMMPGGASGPLPDGNRRGMNMVGGMDRNASTTKTVQVSVPNSYMGAIMGRGGARIRSIREESGAEIRVYEPDKSGSDRIIDITGTPQQITYAQHLLKSCVLLYQEKK